MKLKKHAGHAQSDELLTKRVGHIPVLTRLSNFASSLSGMHLGPAVGTVRNRFQRGRPAPDFNLVLIMGRKILHGLFKPELTNDMLHDWTRYNDPDIISVPQPPPDKILGIAFVLEP